MNDLITRIRANDADAWPELVDKYQPRLLAFVESRLGRRANVCEDIVQESFMGFLTSLNNYDGRPLESYLFSICGYKITDHLRRTGRRPAVQFADDGGDESPAENYVHDPLAKRPDEILIEREDTAEAMKNWQAVCSVHIRRAEQNGNAPKVEAVKLILRGERNNRIAVVLGMTEQQVANYKMDFIHSSRRFAKKRLAAAN